MLKLRETKKEIFQNFIKREKPIINLDKLPDIDEFYLYFITHFNQAEISPDFIPFMYEESLRYNSYISEESDDISIDFWFIGTAIQGDMWFIHKKSNKIFYYDHDIAELFTKNLVDLRIDFFKFLQFLFLCKDFENISNPTDEVRKNFINLVNNIQNNLLENFPFDYL